MGAIALDIARINDRDAIDQSECTIDLIDPRQGLPSAVQWRDLAKSTADPNPFFEEWMLSHAFPALGSDKALLLATFKSGETLLGVMPLISRPDYYGRPVPTLQTWLHGNSFVGQPLLRKGYEELFWAELLQTLDSNSQGAILLHMPKLSADGAAANALRKVLQASDRIHSVVKREERALLQSELDPEAYFDLSLSGKKRKELRRQARRLADRGALRIERVTQPEEVRRWCDQYLWLEACGWKGRNGSALACDLKTAEWFRAIMEDGAADGRVECLSLQIDGTPIAMLANFIAQPGAFAFKTCFDETYSASSPGVLLQWENLALLERDDIAWTDSCAASNHPMIEHFWRERREHVWVNVALGGAARRGVAKLWLLAEMRGKLQTL